MGAFFRAADPRQNWAPGNLCTATSSAPCESLPQALREIIQWSAGKKVRQPIKSHSVRVLCIFLHLVYSILSTLVCTRFTRNKSKSKRVDRIENRKLPTKTIYFFVNHPDRIAMANSTISQPPQSLAQEFAKLWHASTADSNITLYSFRRFKTTHLLNLRFLEAEIAELDHKIYQAGLSLNIEPSSIDRLGLKHCKRDKVIPSLEDTITRDLILQLRKLVKEYGTLPGSYLELANI